MTNIINSIVHKLQNYLLIFPEDSILTDCFCLIWFNFSRINLRREKIMNFQRLGEISERCHI